jgi:hypothetical protein
MPMVELIARAADTPRVRHAACNLWMDDSAQPHFLWPPERTIASSPLLPMTMTTFETASRWCCKASATKLHARAMDRKP